MKKKGLEPESFSVTFRFHLTHFPPSTSNSLQFRFLEYIMMNYFFSVQFNEQ